MKNLFSDWEEQPEEEKIETDKGIVIPSSIIPVIPKEIPTYVGDYPTRIYQDKWIVATDKSLEDHWSTIGIAATGLGKTVYLAHYVRRHLYTKGTPVLILLERVELIDQTIRTLKEVCGSFWSIDREIQKYKGRAYGYGNSRGTDVLVASVKSLTQTHRLLRYPDSYFGLCITDECHHGITHNPLYNNIYHRFGVGPQYKRTKHLGVTATHLRSDGISLQDTYETVAFHYPLLQGIMDGWLVPIVQRRILVKEVDLTKVKLRRRKDGELDYDPKQLDYQIKRELPLQKIVHPLIELSEYLGDRRRVLTFCGSVGQAIDMTEIANRHRRNSAGVIHCKMLDKDRLKVHEDYKKGRYQYLFNFRALAEGYDLDTIRIIGMAAMSTSLLDYTQKIGRGTRPLKSIADYLNRARDELARRKIIKDSAKPAVLVADFIGDSGVNKLTPVTAVDLLAGRRCDPRIKEIINRSAGKRPILLDKEIRRAIEELEKIERRRRSGIVIQTTFEMFDVNPFDKSPDTFAQPEEKIKDRGVPPTEKQVKKLMSFGLTANEVSQLNRTTAADKIQELVRRKEDGKCSHRQKKMLKKYKIDATYFSFKEAGKIIQEIKDNNWQLPRKYRQLTGKKGLEFDPNKLINRVNYDSQICNIGEQDRDTNTSEQEIEQSLGYRKRVLKQRDSDC